MSATLNASNAGDKDHHCQNCLRPVHHQHHHHSSASASTTKMLLVFYEVLIKMVLIFKRYHCLPFFFLSDDNYYNGFTSHVVQGSQYHQSVSTLSSTRSTTSKSTSSPSPSTPSSLMHYHHLTSPVVDGRQGLQYHRWFQHFARPGSTPLAVAAPNH